MESEITNLFRLVALRCVGLATDEFRKRPEIIVFSRAIYCSCSVRTSPTSHLASWISDCEGWCGSFGSIRERKIREDWNVHKVSSKFWWFYLEAMSYATTTETLRLQRVTVEQLRTELKVNRIKVSEAANELKTYVEKIQREDPLVTGVPGNQNPFKERSSCTLF